MQPNAPQTPAPAPPPIQPPQGQQTPYDFFMNQPKPKKQLKMPGGQSTRSRIVIVASSLVVLVIIIATIFGLISSGNKSSTEQLTAIAKQQTELARVAAIGVKDARGTAARNLAITTQLSVQSDQTKMTALLAEQGIKINAKQLATGKKVATDKLLTDATERNQFDEVFTKELTAQITAYQTTVRTAYNESKGPKTRKALADSYKHSQLLLSSKVVNN